MSTKDAAVNAASAVGTAATHAPMALATTIAAVPMAIGEGLYHAPGAIASTASAAATKVGQASSAIRKTLKESMSQENFDKQAKLNQQMLNLVNSNLPQAKIASVRDLNTGLTNANTQLARARESYNKLREAAEDKKEFDMSDEAVEAQRLVSDAEYNVKEIELAMRNAMNGKPQIGGEDDVGVGVINRKKKKKKRTFYALEPTRRHKKRRRAARTQKGRRKF